MARKTGISPHSVYAHDLTGTVFLYKNGKLIRDNLFFGRSKRKVIMEEYFAQIKKNKNDEFYIRISLNL